MTDKDQSPEQTPDDNRRKSFRDKLAKWLSGRRPPEAKNNDLIQSRTTFFDYVRPRGPAGEITLSDYLLEEPVSKDYFIPSSDETVIVTIPREQSQADVYYVLTREEQPNELPKLHVDQVSLPREDSTLTRPDEQVFVGLDPELFFQATTVDATDETITPKAGCRVMSFTPENQLYEPGETNLHPEEAMHRALDRFEAQTQRHSAVMHELDRIFEALDKKKS
jgi:hypothetical protein